MRKILFIFFFLKCVFVGAQDVRFPDIPADMSNPSKRSIYLAEHYWECNNIGDTLLLHHSTVVYDYVYILSKVPFDDARRLMTNTAKLAVRHPETYSYTEYWLEHYLHDALSRFYNDELFIPFLETVISSDIDEVFKLRPKFLLDRCKMNRVGEMAADFILKKDGDVSCRLSELYADYILLWFYQKGCDSCVESSQYLKGKQESQSLIKNRSVILVPLDLDVYSSLRGTSYELQYSPTFYVLDSNHRVLLKEASLERLDAFVEDINN